ncbi:hypothetical protein Tco_0009006 [Tanacetum coccineum]
MRVNYASPSTVILDLFLKTSIDSSRNDYYIHPELLAFSRSVKSAVIEQPFRVLRPSQRSTFSVVAERPEQVKIAIRVMLSMFLKVLCYARIKSIDFFAVVRSRCHAVTLTLVQTDLYETPDRIVEEKYRSLEIGASLTDCCSVVKLLVTRDVAPPIDVLTILCEMCSSSSVRASAFQSVEILCTSELFCAR